MTPSIGDKIIAECAKLTCITDCNFKVSPWAMVAWRPGAAEQLEAVVEAHIEERIREEAEKHLSLIRMVHASFAEEPSAKFSFLERQALKALDFHLKHTP